MALSFPTTNNINSIDPEERHERRIDDDDDEEEDYDEYEEEEEGEEKGEEETVNEVDEQPREPGEPPSRWGPGATALLEKKINENKIRTTNLTTDYINHISLKQFPRSTTLRAPEVIPIHPYSNDFRDSSKTSVLNRS
jgi:hypothetical protein